MPPPNTGADPRAFDPAPGTSPAGTGTDSFQTMSAPNSGSAPAGGVQTTGFGTTQVDDPSALNRAGQGALELGSALHSRGRISDDDVMIAASVAVGSEFWSGELGNAITQMMELWDTQVGGLAATCRDIHTRCTTTANNYTRTEAANGDEMTALRQSTLSDFD
jgi:hypothetical protein